jgi:predicted PurR-regulated permease PerM
MRNEVTSKRQVTRDAQETTEETRSFAFAHRVLIATCIVAGVVLVLVFVWYAADMLLLVFAGILVSILLRGFSQFVTQKMGLGHGLSLALVSLTLLALIVAGVWLIGGSVGSQISELQQQLPQAIESLRRLIAQYDWGQSAIASLPSVREWFANRSGTIVSGVTGLASTTLGVVVNGVVVVIIGLYLAAQPAMYAGGIKRLLPLRYRDRAGEVLGVLDEALGRWLIGRFGLMLINGGLTAAGLWLLGMPLALTLGLLTGLLNFVPNFGPVIAALPAVLIAFLQGPQPALYVALLYVAVQMIDGYLLTPLVDRRSVELPPVLTISAQVLLGLLFGFVGLLVASPLAATVMLLVKMLYIEDVLGDPIMQESVVGERDATAQRMEPPSETELEAAQEGQNTPAEAPVSPRARKR